VRPDGEIALDLAGRDRCLAPAADAALAEAVPSRDPELDRLHRELLAAAFDPSWPFGVAAAVDVCLPGRFYDRFAEHAGAVADRVIYQVTGRTGPAGSGQHGGRRRSPVSGTPCPR
jgi:phosphate transport system protein